MSRPILLEPASLRCTASLKTPLQSEQIPTQRIVKAFSENAVRLKEAGARVRGSDTLHLHATQAQDDIAKHITPYEPRLEPFTH